MTACNDDGCEIEWFGGTAGVCNNVTQICQCPPGFTGTDMFFVFNDCHQKAENVKTLYSVSLAFTVAFILVQFALTVAACYRTCALRVKTKKGQVQYPQEDNSTMLKQGSSERFTLSRTRSDPEVSIQSPERAEARQNSLLHRSQNSLTVHFLFLIFEALKVPILIDMILNPHSLDRVSVTSTMLLCFGWGLFYIASWIYLYIFFKALPDVIHLSRLLRINNVLVRHPQGECPFFDALRLCYTVIH